MITLKIFLNKGLSIRQLHSLSRRSNHYLY